MAQSQGASENQGGRKNKRRDSRADRSMAILAIAVTFLFGVFTLFKDSPSAAEAKYVRIDGSSTVFPITEAVAEEFGHVQPRLRVVVGMSGTGGGFKKFSQGEIDINNASRRIKDIEVKTAKEKGVEYLELPVAYDGITVVVNKKNDWVDSLTAAELKKIWEPGSKVKTWKDVRPNWPDRAIKLYGPGTDSGTFDFFTEAINGKAQASRANFTKSEDDNVLVQGVSGDLDSLGYFGFAYYQENSDKVRAVAVAKGKKSVLPTVETILSGDYEPLSREIYIYVSKASAKRPEVRDFVSFYLDKAGSIVKEVGYIPLPAAKYAAAKKTWEALAGIPTKAEK